MLLLFFMLSDLAVVVSLLFFWIFWAIRQVDRPVFACQTIQTTPQLVNPTLDVPELVPPVQIPKVNFRWLATKKHQFVKFLFVFSGRGLKIDLTSSSSECMNF